MKKIAFIIAATVVASAANAASVTTSVTGTLGQWKSWNAGSQAIYDAGVSVAAIPGNVPGPGGASYASIGAGIQAQAINGVDLVQQTVAGGSLQAPHAPMSLGITGSVTYDNVTGAISAITMSQVGSFTGYYDTDGSSANGAENAVSFSGLNWALATPGKTVGGNAIRQTAGSSTGCVPSSPICAFTVQGVNNNNHSNGSVSTSVSSVSTTTYQSVFDFQGITNGFQTRPQTPGYKTFATTNGVNGLSVNLITGAIVLDVASRLNAGGPDVNAANQAKFTLTAAGVAAPTVPVPAAAWLMGSGLVGLAGIARRRKMA